MTSRRDFLCKIIPLVGVSAFAFSRANAASLISETEPRAIALDYVADTNHANQSKYPKHSPTQTCKNCQLYHGDDSAASAGCSALPGKLVNSNGWCKAYIRKI